MKDKVMTYMHNPIDSINEHNQSRQFRTLKPDGDNSMSDSQNVSNLQDEYRHELVDHILLDLAPIIRKTVHMPYKQAFVKA